LQLEGILAGILLQELRSSVGVFGFGVLPL
jgi:hypothetical protein